MVNQLKTKLCWNCEGRVGYKEEHCQFCGVYLSPTSIYGQTIEEEEDYSSPSHHIEDSLEDKPFTAHPYEEKKDQNYQRSSEEKTLSLIPSSEFRHLLLTLGLLLFGSAFFLFGITLFLFSKDGSFILKWEGEYWFYYLILSVGLLFLGWKSLKDLELD